jgi:hypothetical protein
MAGLLLSGGWAIYLWWDWNRENHFCSTPLFWVQFFAFTAIAFLACLFGTLRLFRKKKNAA